MERLKEKIDYCLNCKLKPCRSGCPLGNDIPQFISYAKSNEYRKAYETISQTTIMPYICGRICPKTKQCQGKCVRGIQGKPVAIGEIESFIGDMAVENNWYLEENASVENGIKIAIIGSGPAGITSAIALAKKGFAVTVFERHKKIGGILRYGIPEFRLEKKYVDVLEEHMKHLGIKIITETACDTIDLKEKYDSVLLATGANSSCKMKIQGEDLPHVFRSK